MDMEHRSVIRCFGLVRLRIADVPELGLTYDTYGMLLEYCEAGGGAAMPLRGGTLKDLLLAQLTGMRDQYSVREALGWLAQVASAIKQFHTLEAPIIHRDIKPDNVLLQVVSDGAADPATPGPAAAAAAARARRNSGSGSFGRGQLLEARLADLGLGVRAPSAPSGAPGGPPPGMVPLGYSHSLGAAHTGHGAGPPALPPISERSLSADDTTVSGAVASGTSASADGGSQAALVGGASMARTPRSPLYTIQEPDESGGLPPALPPSASAAPAGFLGALRASFFRSLSRHRATAQAEAQQAQVQQARGAQYLVAEAGGAAAQGQGQEQAGTQGADGEADAAAAAEGADVVPALKQHRSNSSPSRVSTLVATLTPSASTATRLGTAPSDRVTTGSQATAGGGPWGGGRSAITPQQSRGSRHTALTTGGLSLPAGSLPLSETLASTGSAALSKRGSIRSVSSLLRPNLRELHTADSIGRAMRRVGSLLRSLNKSSLPKFSRESQYQWVFALTGHAGSCMYMAPEVFQAQPYNEKVDVFSFGVMMYELLARELLLVKYIGGTRAGLDLGVADPKQYAKKGAGHVSDGSRAATLGDSERGREPGCGCLCGGGRGG
ncbi:hypothetical protein GPECTOR_24g178 [Gonium pectorale]|uniref:non-specific serine/threonine protein kinase n=1 Tax=Gonium pectorale TaxID=33097 RepID=A0A150GGC2_GONPE|nr:hypothetical protein GPECTOR_24g178 [Gonium pectorale]|eukprot:KXZ48889.1 hypothetical protein GPECTOR_24g178 [Gonium pectorale]